MRNLAKERIVRRTVSIIGLLLLPLHSFASLSIEIKPRDIAPDDALVMERAFSNPQIRAALEGVTYRVLAIDVATDDKISMQVFDYTNDRLLNLDVSDTSESISPMTSSTHALTSTFEEFEDAVRILRTDRQLRKQIDNKSLVPYRAMPDLVGDSGRTIPVGLRPTNSKAKHEIVAVDLINETIERYPRLAPPTARATAEVCGPPSAGQSETRVGTPGSADLVVKDGDEVLWTMNVTRPSASSGRWGSAIELKNVRYKGRLVLHRAHAPILNVDYTRNACGPFRDQVNHENSFVATGDAMGSGFIRTSAPPSTIYDSGTDRGNFKGVAVFEQNSELVVTSELSAGWYRYVSEFRFAKDGSFQPIFKFDAVHNSCTCKTHIHHVYWRLDFDVDGEREGQYPNEMDVLTQAGWQPVATETKFVRGENAKAWRIYNSTTRAGYEVTPGKYDGTTNAFGKGDAWVLRYAQNEIDDSRFGRSRDAKIDRFVNGQPAQGDLVFWYAGHVSHSQTDHEAPHIVGPKIVPVSR